MLRVYVGIILSVLFFTGCAHKNIELQYNQSAEYWYNEIVKAIVSGNLEKADSSYTSLSSEHVASPLISEALLILAQAHMDDEEYVDANIFLDEYIKKFGSSVKNEYVKYLKIRANYASFLRPNRNQQLIMDTIEDTKRFLEVYPNSKYAPMIKSMLVNMELGAYLIDESVILLYKKLDKKDAADFYKERSDGSYLEDGDMINPTVPWYRKWFEW